MYAIKCKKIIDCVNEKQLENKYITIDKGIITNISENIEDNIEVIDFKDYTVMPGLINCHTHICLDPDNFTIDMDSLNKYKLTIMAYENAKKYIYSGVTTIRDLGGVDGIDLAVRDSINEEISVGPEILCAGLLLTMTGGHGHTLGKECDGIDECLKATRTELKKNVNVIKFMATGGVLTKGVEPGSAQLTKEEMTVMVNEAHKKNIKTASHAQGNEGIQNAINAGVDSIEHGFYMTRETVKMLKKNNVYYVPTFSPPYFILEKGIKSLAEEFVRKAKESKSAHENSFKMCLEEGVKIAAGTDGGTPFNDHSKTYFEVVLLNKNGMSKFESILAATKYAADCLGLEDRGTIEVGKRADIIAVKNNPYDNLNNLKDVVKVVKKGKIIV